MSSLHQPHILQSVWGRRRRRSEEAALLGGLLGVLEAQTLVGLRIDEIIVKS